MVRERGTQETNQKKVQRRVIKIDSREALYVFRSVFGDNCTAGVQKKFPSAPKTYSGSLKFGHSFQSLDNVDKVNLVAGLQDISPTIYAYNRKNVVSSYGMIRTSRNYKLLLNSKNQSRIRGCANSAKFGFTTTAAAGSQLGHRRRRGRAFYR
jgi:hypothetical protein